MRENIDKVLKRFRVGITRPKTEVSPQSTGIEEKVTVFCRETQLIQTLGLTGDLIRLAVLLVRQAYLLRMNEGVDNVKKNDEKILEIVDTNITGELGGFEKAKEVKSALSSSIREIITQSEQMPAPHNWRIPVLAEVNRLKRNEAFKDAIKHYLLKSGNPA